MLQSYNLLLTFAYEKTVVWMHPAHFQSLGYITNAAIDKILPFVFQTMSFPLMPFGCFGGMVSILNAPILTFGDMGISLFL